jgi:hypothetical protein
LTWAPVLKACVGAPNLVLCWFGLLEEKVWKMLAQIMFT